MKLRRELLNKENIGLAWSFRVSPTSCDNPNYYQQYITLCAMTDASKGLARTHIFIDEEKGSLAGYIALRATSLISRDENNKPVVNPALEIAELAVSEKYERQKIGTEMLFYALAEADRLRNETLGIKYVAVCADPMAVTFYEKMGFSKLRDVFEIPVDGWNDDCEQMYIELPEIN